MLCISDLTSLPPLLLLSGLPFQDCLPAQIPHVSTLGVTVHIFDILLNIYVSHIANIGHITIADIDPTFT